MERFTAHEKEDTRLTQQELEIVLNSWRDEKEHTVSVADVAEALHCSKAEIEALVWRARAEGVHKPATVHRQLSLRTVMLAVLACSLLSFFIGSVFGNEGGRNNFLFEFGGVLLVAFMVYSSLTVLIDAVNRRE